MTSVVDFSLSFLGRVYHALQTHTYGIAIVRNVSNRNYYPILRSVVVPLTFSLSSMGCGSRAAGYHSAGVRNSVYEMKYRAASIDELVGWNRDTKNIQIGWRRQLRRTSIVWNRNEYLDAQQCEWMAVSREWCLSLSRRGNGSKQVLKWLIVPRNWNCDTRELRPVEWMNERSASITSYNAINGRSSEWRWEGLLGSKEGTLCCREPCMHDDSTRYRFSLRWKIVIQIYR